MIPLPSQIAAYVEASNQQDPAGVARCFVADAIVDDDGTVKRGHAEILAWAQQSTERYRATMDPVSLMDVEGLCVLRASVRGNFPGSPTMLDFRFTLQPDGIGALEVLV
ncbi:nuclear transport factor 2 family protein [Massilia sp. TN1-12]|uniref:nuclear transport factor 2 family protein n=1 Tax=Massilia paldalensis TaxID=3377675 RepID=UPI00384BF4A3